MRLGLYWKRNSIHENKHLVQRLYISTYLNERIKDEREVSVPLYLPKELSDVRKLCVSASDLRLSEDIR